MPSGQSLEVRAASTLLVRAFNVLGVPAHSVNGGLHSNGLPMSLQLIGAPFAENTVLSAAARYEEETGYYRLSPPAAPGN